MYYFHQRCVHEAHLNKTQLPSLSPPAAAAAVITKKSGS